MVCKLENLFTWEGVYMTRLFRHAGLSSVFFFVMVMLFFAGSSVFSDERAFNAPYTKEYLNRVAFPIGGMGAGMYCLEGSGAISHMSVKHRMEFFNEPACFAAVNIREDGKEESMARVLEGPIPDWKYFGSGGTGNGGSGRTYGFPRFREASFTTRFPFADIHLHDKAVPVDVDIVGWSPFTPPEPDPSSLPVGALEYRFRNTSDKTQALVFSFNTRNFMDNNGSIDSMDGGFVLYTAKGEGREKRGAFAVFVDDRDAVVDHCWFRGGWWDALTIAWNNIASGAIVENPPVSDNSPGASLFLPFSLKPGQEKTVRLMMSWYVPSSGMQCGKPNIQAPAFSGVPSKGSASGQQEVSGFMGNGLINTFDPGADGPQGTLTSPEFTINKRYLHFLVGGGSFQDKTCVNILVGGKVSNSACGKGSEKLEWATFDLVDLSGKQGKIQIVDRHDGGWGHILADHFVLSDESVSSLKKGVGNDIVSDAGRVAVLADFEGHSYGEWKADPPVKACAGGVCADGSCGGDDTVPVTYVPWYARHFSSVKDIADHWRGNYRKLRERSELFSKTFYDTTLPPEVVEAVAANLTILKSPTVLRQHDGRIWCWEGCGDGGGCCHGSCAHVWNYAQAFCHLFPSLARGMRETEYTEGTDENGRHAFRLNLPVTPGGTSWDASDGQLGGVMKMYREWRISGDTEWLKKYWPKVRLSLNYAIRKWDPRHTGLLEEDHHNTYDINYYGPDGHCGSFYLGALKAAVKMGEAVGDDVSLYRELLGKGIKRMESELYNGEYFIQIVQKEGLDHNFNPVNPKDQSEYYRKIAEKVNEQGPKYQYGTGCLSDGVLGLWMAGVCAIDDELVDVKKVKSHLMAIYKYNLKHDLSMHANPQRPTYAMGDDGGLLLCSWPHGEKPLLPFVYSDEVWTGIEYQVAAHLMRLGAVEEGLDIVRTCRRRYDGVRRNPFNEYECGHWYARALSSYALLQDMTGMRYDAVEKSLYLNPKIKGDFRVFLSTNTGYGTVGVRRGKPFADAVSGRLDIKKIEYSK